MRFWFGGVYAGRAGSPVASRNARRAPRHCCRRWPRTCPGLAYANLVFLMGSAELMRGDLDAARPAAARGAGRGREPRRHDGFAARLHLRAGRGARQARRGRRRRREMLERGPPRASRRTSCSCRPDWRWRPAGRWPPAVRLAEAIDTVLAEAKVARDRDQPTHELACLQAALQWGAVDGLADVVARARELADELDAAVGRCRCRPCRVAAGAATGRACWRRPRRIEAIGDRCTAADAAAQAAVAFTGCAARAAAGCSRRRRPSSWPRDCGGLVHAGHAQPVRRRRR